MLFLELAEVTVLVLGDGEPVSEIVEGVLVC